MTSTASWLELCWTAVALGGILFSGLFLSLVFSSVQAVESWIQTRRARRWGPRHRFVLVFFASVALLQLVWIGFGLLGFDAMQTPPASLPSVREAGERAGWLLVGMEIGLLIFEGLLLYAWVSARRAPIRQRRLPHIRIPAHDPVEDLS